MSDDSFIREVNEELRQDKATALAKTYGKYAIALAAVVIAGTAAYTGWNYYSASRAGDAGDSFLAAATLADEEKPDEAITALEALQADAPGSYPDLAKLRIASILAQKGEIDKAVATFDEVANSTSLTSAMRNLARLRSAYLLVDHGSFDDVSSRVETLIADANPMRHSAREAKALSAYKHGKMDDALALFEQILDDSESPPSLRQRAVTMASLIKSTNLAGS